MKFNLLALLENEYFEFLEIKLLEIEEFYNQMNNQTFHIIEFQKSYDLVMQDIEDFKISFANSINEHIEEQKKLIKG